MLAACPIAPSFVNAAGGDFRLGPTSVAANAGKTINAPANGSDAPSVITGAAALITPARAA